MDTSEREKLVPVVRTMQIITVAMAKGVLLFGLVVYFAMRPDGVAPNPLLQYIGYLLAVVTATLSFVVPRVITNSQSPTPETYQTGLIIGLALLEGAAFFNVIAYMIEGQPLSLGVAAILAVMILVRLPTIGGVEDWIESRRRQQSDREAFGQ